MLGPTCFYFNQSTFSNFFSREDTKTPVKVGFIALLANLFFNLLLIDEYKHVGLAFATSISAWLNVIILYFILRKRVSLN